MLKTSDFDFDLPLELIAHKPANPRDSSRMLVFQNQKILDKNVFDLADFLNEGDVLVLNDTKVIKAKLVGKRGEARVEINLHKQLFDNSPLEGESGGGSKSFIQAKSSNDPSQNHLQANDFTLPQGEGDKVVWQVFAKPAKRLKVGDIFKIADDFFAKVLNKNNTPHCRADATTFPLNKGNDGIVDLEFNVGGEDFFVMLEKYGQMPLPPYIKKPSLRATNGSAAIQNVKEKDWIATSLASHASRNDDESEYQTIYASNPGAVAAPTAGLHFTEKLFSKLEKKGIKKVFTTLNVGAGTFLPVKSELVKDHQMHSEYFSISKETCDVINDAKKNGKKIIAVGTTSLRVLESAVGEDGELKPQNRETQIFIYPPYDFKIVDVLMTNFHLPKSTLFMLIAAFVGINNAHQIYNHAIKNQYCFYSFGDATLLFKH